MMKARTFLTLLVVVLLASLLGVAIAENAGYVLIAYKNFRYESTLWVFIALFAVLAVIGWLKWRIWRLLGASGQLINPWSKRHRARRVQYALQRGFEELSTGDWSHALRLLSKAAPHADFSLPAYLAAAQAAHKLGEHTRAEGLLDEARGANPRMALSIDLLKARLLIAQQNDVAARDLLLEVQAQQPRHPEMLQLLPDVLARLGDWLALQSLLPELRRQAVLPVAELEILETRALLGRLQQAAEGHADTQRLRAFWQSLEQTQRQRPAVVSAYVNTLRALGLAAEAEAETLLRETLNQRFETELVALYGLVQGRDLTRQLAQAEQWLKAQPNHPVLLLTLGRLSLRNQLWGKARDYLERSMNAERRPETCLELARLLASLGETARSQQVLHIGLGLSARDLPALPLPAIKQTLSSR